MDLAKNGSPAFRVGRILIRRSPLTKTNSRVNCCEPRWERLGKGCGPGVWSGTLSPRCHRGECPVHLSDHNLLLPGSTMLVWASASLVAGCSMFPMRWQILRCFEKHHRNTNKFSGKKYCLIYKRGEGIETYFSMPLGKAINQTHEWHQAVTNICHQTLKQQCQRTGPRSS